MKKITAEQILGERGVNLIQSIVLEMGFTWHGSNQAVEAGIDGWVELRNRRTGEVANGWLAIQSRARSELREDDTTVKYTCPLKDAEYWMQGSQPVILVLSKPDEGLAWWVSIKDYFKGKDIKNDRMIAFDKEQNRLTASTAEDWAALANQYGAGTYFTPPKKTETLTSNLVKVSRIQPTLYRAKTDHTSGKEVKDQLRKVVKWPPWEWFYGKGKHVYSFHNLAESPWKYVCDASSITEIPTERLAFSADEDDRRSFVRLLNGCLRSIVGQFRMRHSAEAECYYFAPNKVRVTRDLQYQSRVNRTKRSVVGRYYGKKDKTRIAFYRHDGFSHRFMRFSDSWYLLIEPTYVFTVDGVEPDPYREERLSKMKSLEGDAAIAGKLVMYSELLKDRDNLIEKPYPFLGFDGLEAATIDAGIDDDAWARIKSASDDESKSESKPKFAASLFD